MLGYALCSLAFAESKLVKINQDIATTQEFLKQNPDHKDASKQLAILFNNKASYFYGEKNYDMAIEFTKIALKYSTEVPQIKDNLSNYYFAKANNLYKSGKSKSFQKYRYGDSKTLLQQSLAVNSKNINSYLLLGEIEYFNQQLDAAQTAWQQVLKYDPNNSIAKAKLSKLGNENEVESRMLTRGDRYFTIKYEMGVHTPPGFDLKTELNKARSKVSRDFKYEQKHKIIVLGYDEDSYRKSVQHAPKWSGALYDGKIRLPLPEKKSQINYTTTSIVHEFTHAVIHDLAKGNCPHWLNEGVAVYMEDKYGIKRNIDNYKKALKYKKIFDLAIADQQFKSHDIFQVKLGYEQSFMFIKYLVKRYGLSKLVKVLNKLGNTKDLDAVFKEVYYVDLAEIEKRWRRSINYF